jgi:hypothetical protein
MKTVPTPVSVPAKIENRWGGSGSGFDPGTGTGTHYVQCTVICNCSRKNFSFQGAVVNFVLIILPYT